MESDLDGKHYKPAWKEYWFWGDTPNSVVCACKGMHTPLKWFEKRRDFGADVDGVKRHKMRWKVAVCDFSKW